MEKSVLISLTILVLINVVDSIINAVVGPSLIFYILESGGTYDLYGMLTSVFFLAHMLMTPVYGHWVDTNGNKYKLPYSSSFAFGIGGSIVYVLAAAAPKGTWAMSMIFFGRILTGLGVSGRTLAYSYVATALPLDKQRNSLTLISMTRFFGMFVGPFLNVLVAEIDFTVSLGSRFVLPINLLNAPGLLVMLGEGTLWVMMYLFLEDPPPKEVKRFSTVEPVKIKGWKQIWLAMTEPRLALPLANMFVMGFAFQLYGVGLAPAGNHLFGWEPVQISYVAALNSSVIILAMIFQLLASLVNAPDNLLIQLGNLCFFIGGIGTYLFWKEGTSVVLFLAPMALVYFGYPWLSPANRSKYTRAVYSIPELEGSHGVMQSLLTQTFALSGFLGPTFNASFVLRTPQEIDSSSDPHELTFLAWYIPVLSSIMILVGFYEEYFMGGKEEEVSGDAEKTAATEESALVRKSSVKRRRSSAITIDENFSTGFEVDRRLSAEVSLTCQDVGVSLPFDTSEEAKFRNYLLECQKELNSLITIVEKDVEME
ncbi:hypothetical protein ACHAWF_016158 [Thalassiosira exigua]